ncbi:MAG: hypothetical protein K0R55_3732 [Sporomusa sp.]|jgi:hypothetical protein|nr:hypothetical protein [Sporomusa sp.]
MNTIIQGISVIADPTLSLKETKRIVYDLIQDWTWEGKSLGKVELTCDGQWVHICSYGRPSFQTIPYPITKNKE